HRAQRAVVVRQGEVPALGEHDVVVQLGGEVLVELDGAVVEADPLGGEVVRAQDGGVPPGASAAQIPAVEHGDVPDPVVHREVVGGGEAVEAAADDHDVVAGAQLPVVPHLRPVGAGEPPGHHVRGGEAGAEGAG